MTSRDEMERSDTKWLLLRVTPNYMVKIFWITLSAVSVVLLYSFAVKPQPHIIPLHPLQQPPPPEHQKSVSTTNSAASNHTTQDLGLESQTGQILRMREVCERIRHGYYPSVGRVESPTVTSRKGSQLKAIVDHYHKMLFCDIGKTGTSSWLSVFKKMVEHEKTKRRQWFKKHPFRLYSIIHKPDRYSNMYKVGFNRLTRGGDAHTEVRDHLPDPRTDYFRFLVVRHPLERLASAYYDIVYNRPKTTEAMIDAHDINANTSLEDGMSFEDFLHYVSLPDRELTLDKDYHWLTFQSNCEPCSIDYNYIGHTETLARDAANILPRYKAEDFIDSFPQKNLGRKNPHKYVDIYKNVSHSVLKAVMEKYQVDADMFGYSFEDFMRDE